MVNYAFTKDLNIPYGTAIERVKDALKKEGFGVLTKIDVQKIMNEKLGVDMQDLSWYLAKELGARNNVKS